ncbi:NAD(P)/FAD-dependent oxidoreductase [Arthrobacter glacialis]|uniref:FAD-dependent oxidoreductase n=1 Tax=Arthrobacter glacialis TaxID=1664 RepID=A0A2S4A0I9_ARTGL|nr:FAD-binding oxidoreductase [Arthrobacter glacialis]POH60574.1 FAD-dependent oxidoreductase [Arthrobacter glacialis]POH75000.1 FAD-dependent oxidoreductase [Arthrobacter glacialis]
MDAQVLIIGGGIAGLSLAWRLAPSVSVVVVEAEASLAFHSSSRSARQMQPSYGPAPIQELTRRSIAMVREISASLAAPILKPRPLITVGSEAEVHALAAGNANLVPLGHGETMKLSPDLRPETFAAAVLDDTAMEVDVPALVEFYRSQAEAAGAVLLTEAPVTAASGLVHGFAVVAGEHTITAGIVVNAAGAWADRVAAVFGVRPRGLVPHRRSVAIVSTTTPANPAGPMVEPADESFYYRPDGGHLLISPCESVPTEPGDAHVAAADIAELIHRINAVTSLGITGVERSWTGLRTHPADGLPVVGFDGSVPDFFWLAGQGGYGIQTSAALATVAAGLLTGEPAAGDAALAAALSPQRASLD